MLPRYPVRLLSTRVNGVLWLNFLRSRIARVSLLEFDVQHQNPPGLLYHIALHLQGMVDSPGATVEQKRLAIQIDTAISKVEALLEQVHQDAKKLVAMSNIQLQQPATL